MSAFRIKTGTEVPSESYVNQNKPEFSKVVRGFKGFKPSLIQKTWLISGSAGLLGLVAVLTYMLAIKPAPQPGSEAAGLSTAMADSSWFVSPLPEQDIPYETFEHPTGEAATYTSQKGSLIHIPALAFTSLDGAPVQGTVQIRFREFHDVMDLFLAGAPMNYDSAGQTRTFESAGMFEINAYQGNQPLKLASQKSIKVDLVSYTENPKFNLYYLDTNTRNWQYLGRSSYEGKKAKKADIAEKIINDRPPILSENNANQAIKPVKAGTSKYIFKVDYDKSRFPELQSYKNLLFEVDESKSTFSASLYKVNWKKVELKPSHLQGHYLLHLSRPDTSIKVYVVPVFASADYTKAIQTYEQSLQQQQAQSQEMQARSEALVGDRKVPYSATSSYVDRVSGWAPVGFRRVNVANLGTYNCDHPLPVNNYAFTPVFTENGKEIIPAKIYLADISVNAIFESEPGTDFKCNRNVDIALWIVMPDKRIAVFSVQDFRNASQSTNHPVFEAQLLSPKQGIEVLENALKGINDLHVDEVIPSDPAAETSPEDASYTKTAPPQLQANLYPNPAKEKVNIDLKGIESSQSIVLRFFNTSGSLIKETRARGGESPSINVSDWDPGTYFCRIISEGQGTQTLKLIKE